MQYARLACILDIIICSGVNTVLITMINWIMLRTVMGELKMCATEVTLIHYRLTRVNMIHLFLL